MNKSISILLVLVGLFQGSSFSQNLKLFINDTIAIVSEQTIFVKTIDGVGISFDIDPNQPKSTYLEIEIMHKAKDGALVTLKKSKINNYKNKFSKNSVKLWYSDNWTKMIPKGFIPQPGIRLPSQYIEEELNIIVFVYTGDETTSLTYGKEKNQVFKRKTKRQILMSSETFKIFQREWTTF